MSKRTPQRGFASELIDSEFERALEETEQQHKARGRRMEQKTQQLCRQVQRALSLALAGEFAAGALGDLFVVGVSAAGGSGRLVVHVAVPVGSAVTTVLGELRERAPQLRAVVAGFISRKRAPELSFVAVSPGSDIHD